MPLPNLIVAGCQKSGTTWLHASLNKSRHIFGSATKELNHFNKPDHLDRQAAYEENFPEQEGVSYYMESTPHYFRPPNRFTDIAMNIRDVVPDAKILLMFRDPVSRYESAYIHHIMQGRLPYTPEITDFTDEQRLLSLGEYGTVLQYWQQIFPDLSAHLYDDLKADKAALINKVMGYLELENDITAEMLEFRINDKQEKVKKLSDNWDVMPRLSPDLYRQLANHYADEIKLLQDLLGRDLQHWCKRYG